MLDFRLTHDGLHWKADRGDMEARGETLRALDRALAAELKKGDLARGQDKIQVRMTFDSSTIPEWIRQYASHYFNRIVTLNLAPPPPPEVAPPPPPEVGQTSRKREGVK